MGVDMSKLREEHAMAQAQAESRAVEAIADRYGTVSYRQGHRRGFWDGVEFALKNPSALIPEPPAHDGPPALPDDCGCEDREALVRFEGLVCGTCGKLIQPAHDSEPGR